MGRPWRLPLAERVLLVAVYYRTNLTMRQLGPLFGVSPATVCRVIQRLGPLLALEPARASQEAVERLWIVDGTLIPVRDRKVGASSRNYRFSANVQVIVDAETRLVVAAARPIPGNTTDAKAWRDSGLGEHCQGVIVCAHAVSSAARRSPGAAAIGPVSAVPAGGPDVCPPGCPGPRLVHAGLRRGLDPRRNDHVGSAPPRLILRRRPTTLQQWMWSCICRR